MYTMSKGVYFVIQVMIDIMGYAVRRAWKVYVNTVWLPGITLVMMRKGLEIPWSTFINENVSNCVWGCPCCKPLECSRNLSWLPLCGWLNTWAVCKFAIELSTILLVTVRIINKYEVVVVCDKIIGLNLLSSMQNHCEKICFAELKSQRKTFGTSF